MVKKTRPVLFSEFLFYLLMVALSVNAADWPRWRGPNGDDISNETEWDPAAPSRGLNTLWRAKVGPGFSNVVIQGTYLYTMGTDFRFDILYCFNEETGKQVWKYAYKCSSIEGTGGAGASGTYRPQTTPIVVGESVYTLSTEGDLYCQGGRKGKVQWYKQILKDYNIMPPYHRFAGSPIVNGDLLIITGNSNGIALDKKTGSAVWDSPPVTYVDRDKNYYKTDSEYATSIFYSQNGKKFLTIYNSYGLSSAEIETGKPTWFQPWHIDTQLVADPIISDKKVFFSKGSGNDLECALYDFSSEKPKVLWKNKNMNNRHSTFLLFDGFLYGCHHHAEYGPAALRCVNFNNDKINWGKDLGLSVCLTAANNYLLILDEKGKLNIAEASHESYKDTRKRV